MHNSKMLSHLIWLGVLFSGVLDFLSPFHFNCEAFVVKSWWKIVDEK